MMHRIRFAMSDEFTPKPKLSGIVEADETYVRGKEKNKPLSQRNPKNLGWKGKVPVFAMVQRNGDVRSFVMDRVTKEISARFFWRTLISFSDHDGLIQPVRFPR